MKKVVAPSLVAHGFGEIRHRFSSAELDLALELQPRDGKPDREFQRHFVPENM
jgi:hypothetical protein